MKSNFFITSPAYFNANRQYFEGLMDGGIKVIIDIPRRRLKVYDQLAFEYDTDIYKSKEPNDAVSKLS